MKRLSFFVSDGTYQHLLQNGDRRTAGRVWLECNGGTQPVFMFERYRHRQSVKVDQLLLSSEHGWLKKSAQRYRMRLSVPHHLGEQHASRLMARESKRLTDFLHDLQQFLNNV